MSPNVNRFLAMNCEYRPSQQELWTLLAMVCAARWILYGYTICVLYGNHIRHRDYRFMELSI